jgi:hypothetical protein
MVSRLFRRVLPVVAMLALTTLSLPPRVEAWCEWLECPFEMYWEPNACACACYCMIDPSGSPFDWSNCGGRC